MLHQDIWKDIILSLKPLSDRIIMLDTEPMTMYNKDDPDIINLNIEGSDIAIYLATIKYKDILEQKLFEKTGKNYNILRKD